MTNKKRVTITAIILITLTGGLLIAGGPGLDDYAADPDEYQATPGDPNDN